MDRLGFVPAQALAEVSRTHRRLSSLEDFYSLTPNRYSRQFNKRASPQLRQLHSLSAKKGKA